MKVAIGSANPSKIEAVKQAFLAVYPQEAWEFVSAGVKSGVTDQPMSDQESIRGATNRAKRAMKQLNADFGVGLEGGLQKIGERWFDSGWIVIIDKEGKQGIGSSLRMQTPPKVMEMVRQGIEVGYADDIIFGTKNSKHGTGHFGLMTNDAVTRSEAYKDAIIAALTRFIHPELFEK